MPGCPLIQYDSHILKSFHTKSWMVERIRNRISEGRARGQTRGLMSSQHNTQGELQLETEAALGHVDRKWIVLGGMEGSGQSCGITDLLCK